VSEDVYAQQANRILRIRLRQVYGRLKPKKALRGAGNGILPQSMDMSTVPATDGIAADARNTSAHRTGRDGSVLSSPGDADAAVREDASVAGSDSTVSSRKRSSRSVTLLEHVFTGLTFQLLRRDALYAQAGFLNFLLSHGEQAFSALKRARHLARQGSRPATGPQRMD
jgi:hypothetical protein